MANRSFKTQLDQSLSHDYHDHLYSKSIEQVSRFVKDQNNGKNKMDNQTKQKLKMIVDKPKQSLNYQADQQVNVKGVKEQMKSQIKNIKNQNLINLQKNKKLQSITSTKKHRAQKQKLAYPPHFQIIPLKGQKSAQLLKKFDDDALKIIKRMRSRLQKDKSAYLSSQQVIHKITYLPQLQKKLSNAYIKQKFIQHRGLQSIQKWIDTIYIGQKNFQPSLTCKLGIFKILKNMHLSTSELSYSKDLIKIVTKNKQSQLNDLRDLATQLIDEWQYSIMMMNKQQSKLK